MKPKKSVRAGHDFYDLLLCNDAIDSTTHKLKTKSILITSRSGAKYAEPAINPRLLGLLHKKDLKSDAAILQQMDLDLNPEVRQGTNNKRIYINLQCDRISEALRKVVKAIKKEMTSDMSLFEDSPITAQPQDDVTSAGEDGSVEELSVAEEEDLDSDASLALSDVPMDDDEEASDNDEEMGLSEEMEGDELAGKLNDEEYEAMFGDVDLAKLDDSEDDDSFFGIVRPDNK